MFLILWAREEKGTGGLGRSLPVPLGSLTVYLAVTLFSCHPGEFGDPGTESFYKTEGTSKAEMCPRCPVKTPVPSCCSLSTAA